MHARSPPLHAVWRGPKMRGIVCRSPKRDHPQVCRRPYVCMTLLQRNFQALGGDCELFAIGTPEHALVTGEAWVHQMHDRLTRFSESSELSRLNASAGSWTGVSAELAALLLECLRAYEVSGGLVHAATL